MPNDAVTETPEVETLMTEPQVEETPAVADETPNPNEAAPSESTPDPDKGKPEEVVGAPENYEDFNLPEGMVLNEEMAKEFAPLAKELDLTQDQAQKLVDVQTKFEQVRQEAAAERWDALKTEWADAAKADTEFGGQNFDANVGIAKKALDQFGTPELKEALVLTGTGSHPEIVRFFYRVGTALSEAKMLTGTSQAPTPSVEQKLYPTMFKDE